uniref:Uncharacterized protein n=1 Tax=Arundo donax TaxID=35708 RepID=A0A0A9GKC0_ARUDO
MAYVLTKNRACRTSIREVLYLLPCLAADSHCLTDSVHSTARKNNSAVKGVNH